MSEHEISDRLTKLEVQVVEKWLAHDKRSDERWADLMEKFHEMAKSVGKTPCGEHIKVTLELQHRLKAIETWQNTITWAIGVVYVALVGAILKVLI
jgi:uncharacterized coiled-coil protein SlyX